MKDQHHMHSSRYLYSLILMVIVWSGCTDESEPFEGAQERSQAGLSFAPKFVESLPAVAMDSPHHIVCRPKTIETDVFSSGGEHLQTSHALFDADEHTVVDHHLDDFRSCIPRDLFIASRPEFEDTFASGKLHKRITPDAFIQYTYYPNGLLSSWVWTSSDGQHTSSATYREDRSLDTLQLGETCDAMRFKGSPDLYYESVSFNSEKFVTSAQLKEQPSGFVQHRAEYIYNDQKRLAEVNLYTSKGELRQSVEYTYDSSNNLRFIALRDSEHQTTQHNVCTYHDAFIYPRAPVIPSIHPYASNPHPSAYEIFNYEVYNEGNSESEVVVYGPYRRSPVPAGWLGSSRLSFDYRKMLEQFGAFPRGFEQFDDQRRLVSRTTHRTTHMPDDNCSGDPVVRDRTTTTFSYQGAAQHVSMDLLGTEPCPHYEEFCGGDYQRTIQLQSTSEGVASYFHSIQYTCHASVGTDTDHAVFGEYGAVEVSQMGPYTDPYQRSYTYDEEGQLRGWDDVHNYPLSVLIRERDSQGRPLKVHTTDSPFGFDEVMNARWNWHYTEFNLEYGD